MSKMTNKLMSTFEQEMQDPDFAKAYQEEYREVSIIRIAFGIDGGRR